MNDCIFCKIIRGEIPSEKIYEDENTLAFLDAHPNNHGHTLVIPKDHFENIHSITDEAWYQVALSVRKIAGAVKSGMNAEGIFLAMNNELGQDIKHVHVHVIPRFHNDGYKTGRHLPYKDNEQQEVGERIRKKLS